MEKRVFLPEVEIVGVIRSERVASPGYPDPAVVYVPLAQAPSPDVKLMVRTRADTAAVMPAIRQAVREMDPGLPLGRCRHDGTGPPGRRFGLQPPGRGSSASSPLSLSF